MWLVKFIFLLVLICAINCISVKLATFLMNTLTVAKLVALVLVILGGAYNIATGNYGYIDEGFKRVEGAESSFGSIALAFYSGLWAYDGWNQLNFVTEEVSEPTK